MTTHTTLFHAVLGFVFVTGMLAIYNAKAQEASHDDHTAVMQANEKFYEALNAMFAGDPTPFQDVWWQTDDIVYMGADGAYSVGWEETYANWEKQASLKIGGHAKAENVQTTITGDMAMTNQYTVGVNEFDGQEREIKLRSTSVFQKKGGVWKMICHHVDVIPPLGDEMQKH